MPELWMYFPQVYSRRSPEVRAHIGWPHVMSYTRVDSGYRPASRVLAIPRWRWPRRSSTACAASNTVAFTTGSNFGSGLRMTSSAGFSTTFGFPSRWSASSNSRGPSAPSRR
ncbi:MAG: hypothetical protein WBD40_13880 [Tepidisphaeraceae bacterium]